MSIRANAARFERNESNGNKEVKFWVLVALGLFALVVIYEIAQGIANLASNAESEAGAIFWTILQAPGLALQTIVNAFSGSGTGSGGGDQVNENTMAEEGLSA